MWRKNLVTNDVILLFYLKEKIRNQDTLEYYNENNAEIVLRLRENFRNIFNIPVPGTIYYFIEIDNFYPS